MRNVKNHKWHGDIFSRHGGSQFTGYWFNESTHSVTIQVDNLTNNLPNTDTYTLVYVHLGDVKYYAIRDNFSQIFGGQTHVKF